VTSRLPGVRPLSVPCPIQNRTSTQERATCAFDLASSIPRSFVLLLTPRFLLRLASRTHRVPTDFVSLGQYPSPCPLCVPPRMQSFSSPSPDTRARGAAGVKRGDTADDGWGVMGAGTAATDKRRQAIGSVDIQGASSASPAASSRSGCPCHAPFPLVCCAADGAHAIRASDSSTARRPDG
jgi:hypothetical protein